MDRIFDFAVDVMFYGFIEGIIYYISMRFLNREFKDKFVDVIKNGFMIGIGLSVCSSCVQVFGLTQFLMGLWIGIYYCVLTKKTALIYFVQGLGLILCVYFIEYFAYMLALEINSVSLLSLQLTNQLRFMAFLICKMVEFLLILCVRYILMNTNKTFLGGTKPRKGK